MRSTVATYANVHDELRKIFARTPDAKALGYTAGDFSYNTGRLRCPVCDGTGIISLDVQFLPDVDIPCPACRGSRYAKEAGRARWRSRAGESWSLPELMAMDVRSALEACREMKTVRQRLQVLDDLGLGYLTLGEETPSLSGGEAQRLKLASEMGRAQSARCSCSTSRRSACTPLDVRTLLRVFRTLIDHGATVVVIEHDLDVVRSADYVVDMGAGRRRGWGQDRRRRDAGRRPPRAGKPNGKVLVRESALRSEAALRGALLRGNQLSAGQSPSVSVWPTKIRSSSGIWLMAASRSTVVPKRAAMAVSVSPRRTTYVSQQAMGVSAGTRR